MLAGAIRLSKVNIRSTQPISFQKALSKKLPCRSLPLADVAVAVRGVTVGASHPHHLPTRSTDGFRGGWSVCLIPDVTVVSVSLRWLWFSLWWLWFMPV